MEINMVEPVTLETQVSEYSTKDLNLAAFLWCFTASGAKADLLRSTPTPSGGKVVMYFTFTLPLSATDTSQLIMAYNNGRTIVEPRAYCAAQKRLKDLIHTAKN